MIATVGVSDLAPPWLDQLSPGGRIVVPLDVRGTQLAVAFEPAAPRSPRTPRAPRVRPAAGHWRSVSLTPCGFMRMRGPLAGPERTVLLQPGLSVMLPDGLRLADGKEVDAEALAGYLGRTAGGACDRGQRRVHTGRLGPWPVARGRGPPVVRGDRRATRWARGVAGLPRRAPPGSRGRRSGAARLRATAGIVDSGGIAVLTASPASSRGPAAGRRDGTGTARAGGGRVRPARVRTGGRARGACPGLGSGGPARPGRAARRRLPAVISGRARRPGAGPLRPAD